MKNALAWFEIPAVDIDRARRFYEAIFDFKMRPLDMGDFRMALFPCEGVGGALCQHPGFYKPSAEAGPFVYLSAEPDLAVVLGRVEAAGGRVVIGKRQISQEWGFMAAFVDCEGNRVGLHSSK